MTEDEFSVYHSLADADQDHRWAFGTGFDDPLAGLDAAVPDGVDGVTLATYCRMLGDDALIYSHRLQQWMTRLPELEEETAVANIALDLLGQARLILARAAKADPSLGPDEDALAFFRDAREFRNVRLVERLDADFAELVARLLVFATWRLALFEQLVRSNDPVLAAIAAKGVNELAYHREYAAHWVVRLGDGTEFSRRRMRAALDGVWPLVDELFATHPIESALAAVAVEPGALRDQVGVVLDAVLATATLERPVVTPLARLNGRSGRDGVHTEALSYVLAELQSVARAHPGATW
ncbi:MAG: phenylacetate-CoA oxygenase subunit PaaC [Actinobacteria bacterium]|nr:phenylacetate-CoA oxygenase subunit PaaC [Actinomycetota bacterium]